MERGRGGGGKENTIITNYKIHTRKQELKRNLLKEAIEGESRRKLKRTKRNETRARPLACRQIRRQIISVLKATHTESNRLATPPCPLPSATPSRPHQLPFPVQTGQRVAIPARA